MIPKVQVLANPQLHASPNPHEDGTLTVAIVFPSIRIRFDVPPEEGQKIFNSMAKAAFQVIQLWNKQEGEIVPVKNIDSGG